MINRGIEQPVDVHRFWGQFYYRSDYQFWLLQGIGWTTLSVISFLSLTLWYNQQQLNYILHTAVQSLLGIAVAWPLRPLFRNLWNKSALRRLIGISLGILMASIVWTVLRLTSFMAMTPERGLWSDFGGWMFGSILIFIGWASLYHGIKYYQLLQKEHQTSLTLLAQNKEIQLQRSRAEVVAREAQLKMLRYQLNPHFLFNTLNAISALVRVNKAAHANIMIVQLSDFLRYSLDNDPIQPVALEEEVRAVQLYLDIEKTRFGDRLNLLFDVDPSTLAVTVPSLILQPLVENAVKYAIAPLEEGGKISIITRREGNKCVIQMVDSGTGGIALEAGDLFSAGAQRGLGVGLKNTIDRLENCYGDDYEFRIRASESGGLCVSMRLPIENGQAEAFSMPTVIE